MNPYYFAVGGLVFAIFIFKRELLVRRGSFAFILIAAGALFVLGIILRINAEDKSSAAGALLAPLLSLLAYRLSRALFVRSMGREPQDTYLNWSKGLAADRVFNILYVAVPDVFGFLLRSSSGRYCAECANEEISFCT